MNLKNGIETIWGKTELQWGSRADESARLPPAFCPFMSLLRKIPPAGLAVRSLGTLCLAAVAAHPATETGEHALRPLRSLQAFFLRVTEDGG